MDSNQYFGELEQERSKNRRLQWALVACIVIILINALTMRAQVGKDRINFIPPEISKPFWLSAEDASPEYFEQLGQYVGLLPLNITPETAANACNQYLVYILPKDRDKFRKKCDVEVARVKRDNVSQMFAVREVRTDAKHRKVVLVGTTSTFIGGKEVGKDNDAYRIEFAHSGGRFFVVDQKRVDPAYPFSIKNPADQ